MSDENKFDDYINEIYPSYKIGYLEFYASDILKQLDPIAYKIMISELEDFENCDSD